jgi:hypothetical protein
MKINHISLIFVLFFSIPEISLCQEYADTLYTIAGEFGVNVKEISEDVVKYTYPDETLLYSISKNTVNKIKHKSGRIEIFQQLNPQRDIRGARDWAKVIISYNISDTKGLNRVTEVSATTQSNTRKSEAIKQNAFKVIKMQTAMSGANIIYINYQNTEKIKNSLESLHSLLNDLTSINNSTSINGIAYSNFLIDRNSIKQKLNLGDELNFLGIEYLLNGDNDIKTKKNSKNKKAKITDIVFENGFINVLTDLKINEGNYCRLIYLSDDYIILMYKTKNGIYNVFLTY